LFVVFFGICGSILSQTLEEEF